MLVGVEGPLVRVRPERTAHQAKALRDRYAMAKQVISAVPSEAAVVVMLEAAGYEVDHRTDWSRLLAHRPRARHVLQYRRSRRVTLRARRKRRRAAGQPAG